MTEKNEVLASGFEERERSDSTAFDFSKAERLERSGSTCDAFVGRYHRRRVFVKRLKPEFRSDVLYRSALDKEFDLGVSISHRSLPRYIEIHDDYVIMDYIDGDTIADLVSKHKSVFASEEFVISLFSQLVDVVNYLHSCNIVHSDIKVDNVMLTRDTRNVMLIDLDKAYTSWLDDTPGNPKLYNEERSGNPDIDFKGIAGIVDFLESRVGEFPSARFARFKKLCNTPGITPARLSEALGRKGRSRVKIALIIAATAVAGTGLVWYFAHQDSVTDAPGLQTAVVENSQEDVTEALGDIALEAVRVPQKNVTEIPSGETTGPIATDPRQETQVASKPQSEVMAEQPQLARSDDNVENSDIYRLILTDFTYKFDNLNREIDALQSKLRSEEKSDSEWSREAKKLYQKQTRITEDVLSEYRADFPDQPVSAYVQKASSTGSAAEAHARLAEWNRLGFDRQKILKSVR